jgi:hypothetical protein
MDGEYENPEGLSGRRTVLSGRPFLFGDFFLWASKEKVTRPRQRTKTDAFPKDQQSHWIPAFAGMTAGMPRRFNGYPKPRPNPARIG